MHQVVTRYFFALDMVRVIDEFVSSCHQCASLRASQHVAVSQSGEEPPDSLGLRFAAEVIKRHRKLIFVLREYISPYTVTFLIPDEQMEMLWEDILKTCLPIRPIRSPSEVVGTDSGPAFKSLENYEFLPSYLNRGRQSKKPCRRKGRPRHREKTPQSWSYRFTGLSNPHSL